MIKTLNILSTYNELGTYTWTRENESKEYQFCPFSVGQVTKCHFLKLEELGFNLNVFKGAPPFSSLWKPQMYTDTFNVKNKQ